MYKADFTHKEWLEWKRLKERNPDLHNDSARLRGEPRAFNPEGAGSSPDAPSKTNVRRFSGNY